MQWNNTMRSRLFFQTLPGTKDDDTTARRKVLELMKANRGPTGEKVLLEWSNGVFVPPAAMTTVETAARQKHVDQSFMSALASSAGTEPRHLAGENQHQLGGQNNARQRRN
jgi:hypothetical protein